jgi:hypothetical protein
MLTLSNLEIEDQASDL